MYTDSSGVLHGFIRSSTGIYTTYNSPAGSVYGSAHVNDADKWRVTMPTEIHLQGLPAGYELDTTLSLAGQVSVGDVNQGGSIVGVFGGKYHGRKDGYLRRPDGTSATIEFPGANTIDSSTRAVDINQTGVIMGQYQLTTLSNGDTVWHGFVVTGVH